MPKIVIRVEGHDHPIEVTGFEEPTDKEDEQTLREKFQELIRDWYHADCTVEFVA